MIEYSRAFMPRSFSYRRMKTTLAWCVLVVFLAELTFAQIDYYQSDAYIPSKTEGTVRELEARKKLRVLIDEMNKEDEPVNPLDGPTIIVGPIPKQQPLSKESAPPVTPPVFAASRTFAGKRYPET